SPKPSCFCKRCCTVCSVYRNSFRESLACAGGQAAVSAAAGIGVTASTTASSHTAKEAHRREQRKPRINKTPGKQSGHAPTGIRAAQTCTEYRKNHPLGTKRRRDKRKTPLSQPAQIALHCMPYPFCHGQLRVAPDNRPLSTRNQALKTTLKTKRKK